MRLTRVLKSGESGEHGCPTFYMTDDPTLVVIQGTELDATASGDLQQVAPDERAVAIPIEMLTRAAAYVASSQTTAPAAPAAP